MADWFCGGEPLAALPVADRGLQYGDGLFETIAIRGGRPRLLDTHLRRLTNGCRRLGLEMPAPERIRQDIADTLRSTGVDTDYAVLKLVLTAGEGPRGYARDASVQGSLLLGCFAARPLPAERYDEGVVIRCCDTPIAIQPALAGLKTLNRLEQVLARAEWQDADIFEGLMCDTEGRLICGTMSNVFLLNDNVVHTPALTRCGVAGVMRQRLLEVLSESGTVVVEEGIGLQDALHASAMFLANSQFGLLPVRRCGDRRYAPEKVQAIRQQLADNGIEEPGS